MTAEERLQTFANRIGITVEDIKTHSRKVDAQTRALWEAKQAGASDQELVALATKNR